MFEACRPFGDNGHVKKCLMKQSHSGVWGSKLYVFTEQIDQVMHSGLNEARGIIIKIKRDAQGKGMALLGFYFHRSQGGCWETGL